MRVGITYRIEIRNRISETFIWTNNQVLLSPNPSFLQGEWHSLLKDAIRILYPIFNILNETKFSFYSSIEISEQIYPPFFLGGLRERERERVEEGEQSNLGVEI